MTNLGRLIQLLKMRNGTMHKAEAEKIFVEGLGLAPGLTFGNVLDDAIRAGRVTYDTKTQIICLVEF